MQDTIKLIIEILVLLLGIPVGNFLAKRTEEELGPGQFWFRLLVLASLAIGIMGVITNNDFIASSFFFIAVVTSRSIIPTKKKYTGKNSKKFRKRKN